MKKSLTEIRVGQSAVIQEVLGGRAASSRLESMGIRPGIQITKVSGSASRGPQTVRASNVQVAMGFGMAKKVLVTICREEPGDR